MIKDERAVEPLIQALREDKDYWVRRDAAFALGVIEDIKALEPLTEALEDEYYGVREAAKQALERIKEKKG